MSVKNLVEVTITDEVIATSNHAYGLFEHATELAISSEFEYNNAADCLKEIKGLAKKIEDFRKGITKPLDDAKKEVMDFFREPKEKLVMAESKIKGALLCFQQEQERIRAAQEAKLRAEIEEKERKQREALEARAKKAEESGKTEKADHLTEASKMVHIPKPVLAQSFEKVSGISTKKVWKFRVVDEAKIPRDYLIPNEKVLGGLARSTQGQIKVPGVEFYCDETISAGRA